MPQPERFPPEPTDPGASLPVLSLVVLVPSGHAGAADLLRYLLVTVDYPKERLRVLVQCAGEEGALLEEVEQVLREVRPPFLSVGLDTGPRTGPGDRPGSRPLLLAALRQQALDWILEAAPDASYAAFVDADTRWPDGFLQGLLPLCRRENAPAGGLLPGRESRESLSLVWFPNPPLGERRVPYELEDIPPVPFAVDSAALEGTLFPVPYLAQFRDRGAWHGYGFSPYYENDLDPDAFLFLTSRSYRSLWVDPGVRGCRVDPSGTAARFERDPGHGSSRIVTLPGGIS